jgi:hypothetical protein
MFAIIVILIQQRMRWTSWQHFATFKIKIACNKVCLWMCQNTFNFSSCFSWNGKNHQLVAYGHTNLAMESFDNLLQYCQILFWKIFRELEATKATMCSLIHHELQNLLACGIHWCSLVEATFKGIGLDHHDANTSLHNSVSFGGEFSHDFNLKNMISTHTKDFWEKNGPGSPDF